MCIFEVHYISKRKTLNKVEFNVQRESGALIKAWRTFILLKCFQSSFCADETSSHMTNWQNEWVWTFLKSFRLFVLFSPRRLTAWSSRSPWLRSDFLLIRSIIQLNCFAFLIYSFKNPLPSHMSVPQWCFCSQPLVFNLRQSWIVNHLGIKSVFFKHGWIWTLWV